LQLSFIYKLLFTISAWSSSFPVSSELLGNSSILSYLAENFLKTHFLDFSSSKTKQAICRSYKIVA